jgi:predicted nucleotide-binding protein
MQVHLPAVPSGVKQMKKRKLLLELKKANLIVVSSFDNGQVHVFKLDCDASVALYPTGTVRLQGHNAELVRRKLGFPPGEYTRREHQKPKSSGRVLVVCGRDRTARAQLKSTLKRLRIQPQYLSKLSSGGETLVERLESAQYRAKFAIVLATPDELGCRRDKPYKNAARATPRVVMSIGMLLAYLGRRRVVILVKEGGMVALPVKTFGLRCIPYRTDVADARAALKSALLRAKRAL